MAREPKRFFVLCESAGSCFSGLVFQLYNWRSKSLGPGSEAGGTQKISVQRHIGKHIISDSLNLSHFLITGCKPMLKEKSDYSQPNALTVQTTAGVLPDLPV